MLAGRTDNDREYGFMCECGCDATVPLTLAKLDDDGGAWVESHRAV